MGCRSRAVASASSCAVNAGTSTGGAARSIAFESVHACTCPHGGPALHGGGRRSLAGTAGLVATGQAWSDAGPSRVLCRCPSTSHAADDSATHRLYDETDGGKAHASAMSTGGATVTWVFGVLGPLGVLYGLFVAWTGWLPRWMAARYEPRLFGLGTVLQAAGITWFWVVALEMRRHGPVVVPPMLVVAVGMVAATVAGLPVWVRHFDCPPGRGRAPQQIEPSQQMIVERDPERAGVSRDDQRDVNPGGAALRPARRRGHAGRGQRPAL